MSPALKSSLPTTLYGQVRSHTSLSHQPGSFSRRPSPCLEMTGHSPRSLLLRELQLSLQPRPTPVESMLPFYHKKMWLTSWPQVYSFKIKHPAYLTQFSSRVRVGRSDLWTQWQPSLQSALSSLCNNGEDLSYLHIIFQGIWAATHSWE